MLSSNPINQPPDPADFAAVPDLGGLRVPELIAEERIRLAHRPMSEKLGAIVVRNPETPEELARIKEVVDGFVARIEAKHGRDLKSFGAGITAYDFKVERFKISPPGYSFLLDIRGDNGEVFVPNDRRLLKVAGGPVSLWVRDTQNAFQVLSLYSPGAFKEEVDLIRRDGDSLFLDPERSPLLLTYLLKEIDGKTHPLTREKVHVLGMAAAQGDDTLNIDTTVGPVKAAILRDPLRCNISYRIRYSSGTRP